MCASRFSASKTKLLDTKYNFLSTQYCLQILWCSSQFADQLHVNWELKNNCKMNLKHELVMTALSTCARILDTVCSSINFVLIIMISRIQRKRVRTISGEKNFKRFTHDELFALFLSLICLTCRNIAACFADCAK